MQFHRALKQSGVDPKPLLKLLLAYYTSSDVIDKIAATSLDNSGSSSSSSSIAAHEGSDGTSDTVLGRQWSPYQEALLTDALKMATLLASFTSIAGQ